jgi:beta-lactamase class A
MRTAIHLQRTRVTGSWPAALCALAALSALAASSCTRSPATLKQSAAANLAPLEAAIRARIADEPGDFGIAIIDLGTGARIGINDDLVMHAASTMKVPVLLELYRRAGEGSLDLDGTLQVHTRFRSIADTSHYELHASDDSDAELYTRAGTAMSLRELARRMIVRSSNLATNLLIDTIGAESVMQTLARVGVKGMTVRRGVEDGPAYAAGLNNTTSARGLADTFAAIARCDLLPREECDEAIDVLKGQELNDVLPAGLPDGAVIAHKTGWITGIQHDGGIVYPSGSAPFVIVVLTHNASSDAAAKKVGADIARLAWAALARE